MKKFPQIRITVVQNGYEVDVRDDSSFFDHQGVTVRGYPYVFSTFNELTNWLGARLEHPKEGPEALNERPPTDEL